LEKLKVASSLDEVTKLEVMSKTKEVSSTSEMACSKRSRPRALIFKANEKDLHKIKKLIETQFPEVEIIYVTSGHTASILRVTKSMLFETQNSSMQPLYTIE
jgi:hypothetical protein